MAILPAVTVECFGDAIGSVETCRTICFYNIWSEIVVLFFPALSCVLWFSSFYCCQMSCVSIVSVPSCSSLPAPFWFVAGLKPVCQASSKLYSKDLRVHSYEYEWEFLLELCGMCFVSMASYLFLCFGLSRWSSHVVGSF